MSETDRPDSEAPDVCPECGCEEIVDVENDERDDLVCVDCGLVVSGTTTTCAFSSWALYGDGERDRRESPVGPPGRRESE